MFKNITRVEWLTLVVSAIAGIVSGVSSWYTYNINVQMQETNERTLAKELQHQKYELEKELGDELNELYKLRYAYIESRRSLVYAQYALNKLKRTAIYKPYKKNGKQFKKLKDKDSTKVQTLFKEHEFYKLQTLQNLNLFCIRRLIINKKIQHFSYVNENVKGIMSLMEPEAWCDDQQLQINNMYNIPFIDGADHSVNDHNIITLTKSSPSWFLSLNAEMERPSINVIK